MSQSIDSLFNEIKGKLTVEHLKSITVDIINAYKNKKYSHLRKYKHALKINEESKTEKLFSILIKKYHPDRISFIQKQVDQLRENNDYEKLLEVRDTYFFTIKAVDSIIDESIEFETEFTFDSEDFGYREKNIYEEDNFGESNLEFEEEYNFVSAVKNLFFGGLDIEISESDLRNLDGSLDLSDYDLSNISGIEHCLYINELNLSGNNIEKIGKLAGLMRLQYLFLSNNSIENVSPLENLENLKELDLSFNEISNIHALKNLKSLQYLNLIGNPISDYSVIEYLIERGVIVIFEDNILT